MELSALLPRAGDTGSGRGAREHALHFLAYRKKTKKRKSFKAETIKRLSSKSKCYFSYSRAFKIQEFSLSAKHGGQTWWLTIFFSVPWPFHFEIHFAGPASSLRKQSNLHSFKKFTYKFQVTKKCIGVSVFFCFIINLKKHIMNIMNS